jgi:hypothetical protein
MKKGIITIEHKDHSTVELTNLKTDTFTYDPNKCEGLEDFLNGAVLRDKPEDNFIVEFSDNEIQIVTRQQLEIWQNESIKFDGFDGFTIKGRLMNL